MADATTQQAGHLLFSDAGLRALPTTQVYAGKFEITNVQIDSRLCGAGSFFVALPGTKTDGHVFVEDAIRRGAAACLIKTAVFEADKPRFESIRSQSQTGLVVSPDPLHTLQRLAALHMHSLSQVCTIAITGSSGKTTTKEIIGHIISAKYAAAVSAGNLNSEIGLPLAAFRVTSAHAYAVFEMGVNHPGEMDILVDIVRPKIAVVTNIGSAHIGPLGSQEGIAREKRKIFTYLPDDGAGFIAEDEAWASFLQEGAAGRFLRFGRDSLPELTAAHDEGLRGWRLEYRGEEIRFPLFGRHNLQNALCGMKVAEFLGIGPSEIRQGLESVQPLYGRGELISGPVTVLRDCYNANLESMIAMLRFMREAPWQGRKVAVLGSMLEQGSAAAEIHLKLGEAVAESGLDAAFLYGREMVSAQRELQNGKEVSATDSTPHIECDAEYEILQRELLSYLSEGDLVLIKGSLGMDMNRFALAVFRRFGMAEEDGEC